MSWPIVRSIAALCLLALTSVVAGNAWANDRASSTPPTDAEALGKRIFFEGEGMAEGGITAILGAGGFSVPASAVPCANCHGDDGLGRPEGGVEPSNITWPQLTKPYGLRHASGRHHPAYDEQSFARALRTGIDPAGTPLDAAMPKYRLSDDEVSALVAHLKRLGSDLDPGLTADRIHIGGLLPLEGPSARLAQSLRRLIQAYFDKINQAGGIYGRHVAFDAIEAASTRPEDAVFSVIAVPMTARDLGSAAALGRTDIPVVIPYDPSGGGAATTHRNLFFLLGSLAEQTRALMSYGKQHLRFDAPRVSVVVTDDTAGEAIADAVSQQAELFDWPAPTVVRSAAADTAQTVADKLKASTAHAVIYAADTPAIAGVAETLAARGLAPYLLIAGQVGGAEVLHLPVAFADRVFISFPNVPRSGTRDGFNELEDLRRKAGLNVPPNALMAATLSTAKVLTEGLRAAGRSLSRRKLIDALQHLHVYETGLTPAISFGPRRRTGADGVYVLAADIRNHNFLPGAAWMRVDSRL